MRNIRNVSCAVVGGGGFLGSHCTRHLIEDRGCKVLVIDNLVAGRREFVHKDAAFVHHDITGSEDYLRRAFAGIDYVLNYAAYPYIPDSFDRPLHVCTVNFNGAVKVINAAQEAGCKGILQISSAEIYGEGRLGADHDQNVVTTDGYLDESAPVAPHSSYGASKAAVDFFVQAAWRERKTPCIALRQFNCTGEASTHPYVIPEIIGQLVKYGTHPIYDGKRVVRLGNNSFRDFLYAGDQARMAVELLEKGNFGEVYNLGSETGIKMYDLAKLVGEVMGFKEVKVEQDPARVRPWEIWSLLADCTKVYSVIDSRPTVPLREALERTVAWFREQGGRWPWQR